MNIGITLNCRVVANNTIPTQYPNIGHYLVRCAGNHLVVLGSYVESLDSVVDSRDIDQREVCDVRHILEFALVAELNTPFGTN